MPDMMLTARVISEDHEKITLEVMKNPAAIDYSVSDRFYAMVFLDSRQQPWFPWSDEPGTGGP